MISNSRYFCRIGRIANVINNYGKAAQSQQRNGARFMSSHPKNSSRIMKEVCVKIVENKNCPFCCKVRAFLDYSGLSYTVIEVDTVWWQSLKWSTYKKVPSLLARKKDGPCVQLTESSMIVSTLATYLNDPTVDIGDVAKFYPQVSFIDDNGIKRSDVHNKYFLMFGEKQPTNLTFDILNEERKWRSWIDNHFIHLIPAYGNLQRHLRNAFTMPKFLMKRHGLEDDARQEIYSACNKWTKELEKKKSPFMGGATPNLADIEFYGALTSMEGCKIIDDIRQHTKLETWFGAMKKVVTANGGNVA